MLSVLVFDFGTTFFKACIFGEDGTLVTLDRTPAPVIVPEPGRAEMTVADFRDTVTAMAARLRARAPEAFETIAGVSFSSQTNTFVLLDEDDAPLTPFLLWSDQRARGDTSIAAKLASTPIGFDVTGVPALSPEFMTAKLLWLEKNTLDTVERAARLCLLSDYFTLWLTGRHITEAGVAGLTGLLNIRTLGWTDTALHHFHITPSWMPDVKRAGTDLGTLRPEACEALGLPRDCRFIVGCLDQYAGAVGAGNVLPGSVSETTGTVLATVRCASALPEPPPPGVFVGPGYDRGIYYEMIFGDVSGRLLEIFRDALPEPLSFDELVRLAEASPPGANGLTLDRHAATQDLHAQVTAWAKDGPAGDTVRAILEAVALALRDQVDTLCVDAHPNHLRCVGGAARSCLWRRIKADALDLPTVAIDCHEPTSLGAAMLAWHGLTGAPLAEIARPRVREDATCAPNAEYHATYAAMP